MTTQLASTVALLSALLLASAGGSTNDADARVLHLTDSGFRSFLFDQHARILRVTRKDNAAKLSAFSTHYKLAARQLKKFDIQLAQLSCDTYPDFEICTRPNADLFLYGFRGSAKEKLSLPLSTLEDENAIVASALHLELIQTVPIVQSLAELDELYKKCARKCDIVLSFQSTLGTKDHSVFLNLAWRLSGADRLFVLSTSSLASPLMRETAGGAQDPKQPVALWLVQCKAHGCQTSTFAGPFQEQRLEMFVSSLDFPTWFKMTGPLTEVLDGQMQRYSQLMLIYDKANKKRATTLAKALAVTFRGAVLVSVVPVKTFRSLTKEDAFMLEPPSLLFVPVRNGTLLEIEEGVLQNGFENFNDFVRELLGHEEMQQTAAQNRNTEQISRLAKNIQEIAVEENRSLPGKRISANDGVSRTPPQCTPAHKDLMELRLYYLEWDEASKEMLWLLDRLEARLELLPVRSLSRVCCLADRDTCAHVHTFPTFEFSDSRKSAQAGKLTWKELNTRIYKFAETQRIREISSVEDLMRALDSPRYEFIESVGLVVDLNGNLTVKKLAKHNLGIDLILAREQAGNYLAAKLNCTDKPCFGIQKFRDEVEPLVRFQGLFRGSSISAFIDAHKDPIFVALDAEDKERMRGKLLVIALGSDASGPISESARRAVGNPSVIFTYVPRSSGMFEVMRQEHLPAPLESALLAMNMSRGTSFLYRGDWTDAAGIERWLGLILEGKLQPSAVLPEKHWGPSAPAIDYLALSEQTKSDQDEMPEGDADDLFIASDADFQYPGL